MTGYYWLDGQEHSLCPARHTYLATPLRTSEVTVIISDIGRVANTLQGWVEVNNLTHWLTITDWLVERHLHLATLHKRYACEDDLTTIKRAHRRLDALAECWGADVAHAMFDVARTHHHVTRDRIKCDTSTPTALPTSPSLASDILARPELPHHLKTIVPSQDRKNWPQKLVGESAGVKEAEERRREERRPEKRVKEWPQHYQEQELRKQNARGTPALPSPTASLPCTHITGCPTMPMVPMLSRATPPHRSIHTRMTVVTQDADDVPATSPAPGARDRDSAAPTRTSTATQRGCMTAPTVASAQDADNVLATSPARRVQARDSPTPMCLAVRATNRPTAQVAPSTPTHCGCATKPAAAAVQDADVAPGTPPAPRVHHAGADTRMHPAPPTPTASPTHCTVLTTPGVHTQDDVPATPPTPRARHASATTRERTASPMHPITASPMHCTTSPA
ncbi:hypothetical protein SCP_0805630 [Sparassis crispa]|uniref:Uncharacterized protein n=1 Tax=Sparassis crispa TaxID=139825 RepID=A0A401GV28_9APHY|nr:hypothetical protein SCP_0805630 [Sparassis crispa]GBE86039.1 hypothetical protein SCP_0805630 [Sparassis crispa]